MALKSSGRGYESLPIPVANGQSLLASRYCGQDSLPRPLLVISSKMLRQSRHQQHRLAESSHGPNKTLARRLFGQVERLGSFAIARVPRIFAAQ